MSALDDRIRKIATVPILLVASDYDGTISPIVDDPSAARPMREAIVAIRMLATLDQTHVSVISGRALADLAQMTGLPEDVHLIGSHGSEFDLGFPSALPDEATSLRERIAGELTDIASRADGLTLEHKPASVALHFRNAEEAAAKEAISAIEGGPATIEGVYTRHGKKVIELSVVATDKGTALETIRHRCGASAVIFFGDDHTDEDAFRTLHGPDLAIKVGAGDSAAPFRVEGPEEVARLLAHLAELRADWLEGAHAVPIENHSILSDQRTVALITTQGRLNWMCAPRIDAPALFAELVGGPAAGHFSIKAADGIAPIDHHYAGASHVLITRWPTFTVTDLLDCSSGRPQQRAGRTDLIRIVDGTGRAIVEFAPRLDFGRVPTRLSVRGEGLVVEDTLDPIVLRSPGVHWSIEREGAHDTARAEIELDGKPLAFDLRYGTGTLRDGGLDEPDRVRLTDMFWSSWAKELQLPRLRENLVTRSALVLKALCHGPTGAIAAAATSSLPEHIGGVRNWDYRYCWLRDAAMSAASLARLGSTSEAMAFLNWMCSILDACESPDRLQPLYTVTGGEFVPEAEITELAGYRASRPVRIGNAASRQVQLDVFGPIVDLIALLTERNAPLSSEHWRLVEAMVVAVEHRWREPDHGIWEIRRPRRHHVHSKAMCWFTVDRAITIAKHFLDRNMPGWTSLCDEIRSDLLEHGYKPDVGAFTAAYDDVDLDAAALLVGLTGLVPPSDERFVSTVRAIEQGLRDGPTVYRYRADDGLPGTEGGFHLCAGWLIQSMLLLGRVDDARNLFDELCDLAGPTGMLSEQYDPGSRRALGNTPQAYSHIAVIDSALRLHESGGAD